MFRKNAVLRDGCLAFLLLFASASWAGDGLFQAPQSYDSGGGGTFSIAVGEVNGDGKPDLLVANFCNGCHNGLVGVMLGNGNGTFQAARTYDSGGWGASWIAVADVNGDGRLDVLVANSAIVYEESSVGVLLGNGDGTFQAARTYGSGGGHPSGEFGNWMAVRDVNGDGQLDVLVANECRSPDCQPSEGGVGVLLGNGDGTFQAVRTYSSGGALARSIAVADVNRDGKPDLLVTNQCVDPYKRCDLGSVVSVLLGNGDGTFTAAQSYDAGGVGVSSIAVEDVNGDGKPDLLVAEACRGNRRTCGERGLVGVLLGNGDGTFQAAQRYRSGGSSAQSIAVADVNEDGHLDLLVANQCIRFSKCDISVVGVLLGNGDGTFQDAQIYDSGGGGAESIAVEDVNGDGAPDLLVANGVVIVRLGRFGTTTTLQSSLSPSVYGQSVTFAATVSSGGPNAPTGTVTFKDGIRSLGKSTLNGGVATLTTRILPAGTLSITATYSGDSESIKSISPPVSEVVDQASTTTAIRSSVNPSAQGQPVVFTAKVASPTAHVTGTVTFTAGTTTLGTVTLSGAKASITTSALPKGSDTITVTYTGTSNIIGSAASLTQIVN